MVYENNTCQKKITDENMKKYYNTFVNRLKLKHSSMRMRMCIPPRGGYYYRPIASCCSINMYP